MNDGTAFWHKAQEDLLQELGSSVEGLKAAEARRRRDEMLSQSRSFSIPAPLRIFLSQFRSPITLTLLLFALLSLALLDRTDGTIILCILLASALMGFRQERGAERVARELAAMVQVEARVLRNGAPVEIEADRIVPGDVAVLSAGDLVPGDCLLLEARNLFVDESPLTGESLPVEKRPGLVAADAPPASRTNVLCFGTHVVSGMGSALVVRVGEETEFGESRKRLAGEREADFQRGVAKFGAFLGRATFALVLGIFCLNVFLHRPILESLLFSLALAVGLTPQLLPAVIRANLARGARAMAAKRAIVRRIASIENLDNMDVLCLEETGTLSSGKIRLKEAVPVLSPHEGDVDARGVLALALLNAAFQTGVANPLDAAVQEAGETAGLDVSRWERLDELPCDFLRKRQSILARSPDGEATCVVKGAFPQVAEICDGIGLRKAPLTEEVRRGLTELYETYSDAGFRTIGVAVKTVQATTLRREDEAGMSFVGFLVFEDPVREDASEAIGELGEIGVTLRIITGEDERAAASAARRAGIAEPRLLTGSEIRRTGDDALVALVERADVFAEVDPNQKERLVLALKKGGHVVGYMGDGIDDIPALNAADVGIAAAGAVGAARQAADVILPELDLRVLAEGAMAGRRAFANAMKYVFTAASANFGNMFGMACATLFLPFLPLLPRQILLTNILTDLPELAMSSDNVDPALTAGPRRWDVGFVRRFMLRFGVLSAAFDIMIFAVLLIMRADVALLRTGWFVESVVSAAAVMLLVRTRRPLWEVLRSSGSRPRGLLVAACTASAAVAIALPFTRVGQELLGFVALPPGVLVAVGGIVALHMLSVEVMKSCFWPS